MAKKTKEIKDIKEKSTKKEEVRKDGIQTEKEEMKKQEKKEEKKGVGEHEHRRDPSLNISDTLDAIRMKFGDDSIMKLGEKPKVNVNAIPTGSIGLDAALGVG